MLKSKKGFSQDEIAKLSREEFIEVFEFHYGKMTDSEKMRLAAPYSGKYERDQTYPEWPLALNRIVRTVDLAVNYPNHVGRFRDYAFPQWWRWVSRIWKS